MKLKEFELWAFKLATEEASAILLFSRSVFAHFERHFEPIDTEGVYRVILKLCGEDSRLGTAEISSSVLKYYKRFDFASFGKLDEKAKKVTLLEIMYNSLLELADIYEWDKKKFHEAYIKVKHDDFINHYFHNEKWNRTKKLCAKVFCEHESNVFRCTLLVIDKDGSVILKRVLFEEKPDEFFFNSKLVNVKWIDKGKFQLSNKVHTEEVEVT